MRRRALHALLYNPARQVGPSSFEDVWFDSDEHLHGWRFPAEGEPVGHLLYCHGNGGNVTDRAGQAAELAAAGLNVLLFDYRGYGRSSGRPSEEGTYRDARAALAWLRPRADPVFYLGESLGGAIALELALAHPPAGLILQSTFTSVRGVARVHYPYIPRAFVLRAYPSLSRIGSLRAPLLVLHGDDDLTVPVEHGRRLFAAAPEPKTLHIVEGATHSDLSARVDYGRLIADWCVSATHLTD